MSKHASLFASSQDRIEWIQRNAEFCQEFQRRVNHAPPDEGLGSIDKPYSALWVSNNQCKYDEEEAGKLRFTLEQLRTMTYEQNEKMIRDAHYAWFHTELFPDEGDLIG